jgi:hypothetical protein
MNYQTFKQATATQLRNELSAEASKLPTDWIDKARNEVKRSFPDRLEDRELVPMELLWSYWLEEAGLVQAMHAISLRFQNKAVGPYHALARFDLTPLRGISELIWGYIQDEVFRLSLRRRAYEYLHQYGLRMIGKAVGNLSPADERSRFLQAFHELLAVCVRYYAQLDNLTIQQDARPVLSKLKELQFVLSEGAHNQFGDLPFQARLEMRIIQFILERPEIREFLGGRIMVAYPAPWMDRLDTLRRVMRWGDTSVTEFNNLAECGERVLLRVRYGAFHAAQTSAIVADNFAIDNRDDIVQYINSYQAVTGVDLGAETGLGVDATQPSVYLNAREARLRRAL